MKLIWIALLSAVAVIVPGRALALERDMSSVFNLEIHAGASLPAPIHGSSDGSSASAWSRIGPNAGLSFGYGFARSFAARVHFDAFFFSVADDYGSSGLHLYDVGVDAVTCFGNADKLLWRPFAGIGYANTGNTGFALRAGLEALLPFSGDPSSAGLVIQALVETAFVSNSYEGSHARVGPMVALRAAFDIL